MIRLRRCNPYSTHNIKVEVGENDIVVFNNKIWGCVMWRPKQYNTVKEAKRDFNTYLKNETLKAKLRKNKFILYEHTKSKEVK